MKAVFSVSAEVELVSDFKKMVEREGGSVSGHMQAAMREYLGQAGRQERASIDAHEKLAAARDAAEAEPAKPRTSMRELFEELQNKPS